MALSRTGLGRSGPKAVLYKTYSLLLCLLEQSRVNTSREQLDLIGSRLALALGSFFFFFFFFYMQLHFFLYYLEQNFMYMIK